MQLRVRRAKEPARPEAQSHETPISRAGLTAQRVGRFPGRATILFFDFCFKAVPIQPLTKDVRKALLL